MTRTISRRDIFFLSFCNELFVGGGAELLQELRDQIALALVEPRGRAIHRALVLFEDLLDTRRTLLRERHDARASIARIERPLHEPALFEPIDRSRDRPTRELDAPPNLVDG